MKHKFLTWLVMITLIVGQSYAYAFSPCEANPINVKISSDTQLANEHSHEMSYEVSHQIAHDTNNHTELTQQPQQHKCDNACCEQECSCPVVVCPPALLMEFSSITFFAANATADTAYLFPVIDTFLASLRKPPIPA